MIYWRKAEFPKEKPSHPDTYFVVYEVGDTHWHGAAIWNGEAWEPEDKVPALKRLQPTYFLRKFTGVFKRKEQRFVAQQLPNSKENVFDNGDDLDDIF